MEKKNKPKHPSTIWEKKDYQPHDWKKGNWFYFGIEDDEVEEEKDEEEGNNFPFE